jgi:hypothetical protein
LSLRDSFVPVPHRYGDPIGDVTPSAHVCRVFSLRVGRCAPASRRIDGQRGDNASCHRVASPRASGLVAVGSRGPRVASAGECKLRSARRLFAKTWRKGLESRPLAERFNVGGHLVAALLSALPTTVVYDLLLTGIESIWIRILVGVPCWTLAYHYARRGFFNLLRRGWFRGLFRERP